MINWSNGIGTLLFCWNCWLFNSFHDRFLCGYNKVVSIDEAPCSRLNWLIVHVDVGATYSGVGHFFIHLMVLPPSCTWKRLFSNRALLIWTKLLQSLAIYDTCAPYIHFLYQVFPRLKPSCLGINWFYSCCEQIQQNYFKNLIKTTKDMVTPSAFLMPWEFFPKWDID